MNINKDFEVEFIISNRDLMMDQLELVGEFYFGESISKDNLLAHSLYSLSISDDKQIDDSSVEHKTFLLSEH